MSELPDVVALTVEDGTRGQREVRLTLGPDGEMFIGLYGVYRPEALGMLAAALPMVGACPYPHVHNDEHHRPGPDCGVLCQ